MNFFQQYTLKPRCCKRTALSKTLGRTVASGAQTTNNCRFPPPGWSYGEEKVPPRDSVQQRSYLRLTLPIFWTRLHLVTTQTASLLLFHFTQPVHWRQKELCRLSSVFPRLILSSTGKALLVREKRKLTTSGLLLLKAQWHSGSASCLSWWDRLLLDNTLHHTERSLHCFSVLKFNGKDESEIPVLLKVLSNL